MPRIDSSTGCEVMTMAEFWQHEAQTEGQGRAAADVADDFYADLRREEERETRRLLDPIEALSTLKAYDDQEEPKSRIGGGIAATRRVLRASFHLSANSSKASLVAEVECVDGSVRFVRWIASSWGGGHLDPPESDEGMEEVSEAEAREVQ